MVGMATRTLKIDDTRRLAAETTGFCWKYLSGACNVPVSVRYKSSLGVTGIHSLYLLRMLKSKSTVSRTTILLPDDSGT